MKTRLLIAIIVSTLASALAAAPDEAAARERITAAFMLTFGRMPSDTELKTALANPPDTPVTLVARFRRQLGSDATARRAVAARAWEDAFGLTASDADPTGRPNAGADYSTSVNEHVLWLRAHPDAYRAVIDRAYRATVRRPAYDLEFEYWKQYQPLSFVLLVGCIEGWARRNAPGLMATTGNPALSVNSSLLTTLSVAPAVADALRTAFALQPSGDAALARAAGRNVVAAGADPVVSLGGMFVVVVGDQALTPRAPANHAE